MVLGKNDELTRGATAGLLAANRALGKAGLVAAGGATGVVAGSAGENVNGDDSVEELAEGNEGVDIDEGLAGLVLGGVGSGNGRRGGEESEEGLGEHCERYEVGVGGSEEEWSDSERV